jgi:acetyltransferase-like isoleucine patch superfamily enzyme
VRRFRRRVRLGVLALVALLPGFLKRGALRLLFGFRIGRGVRIGFSLLDARAVDLADGVRIGHLNVILGVDRFEMGRKAVIGTLNVIRGGERVSLGAYSTIMRLNVVNAIPDHDCTTEPLSRFRLDDGAILVSEHRIDFTDEVRIGRNVIVGGRQSSFWTHNRQQTAPLRIGDFCYVGSEVRLAPGASLPEGCILGLGSVLIGAIDQPGSLVAGVPARVVRPLGPEDQVLVRRKTRKDIPDNLYGPGRF